MSVTSLVSLQQFTIAALGQAFTPAIAIQNTTDFVLVYTNPTTLADTPLTNVTDYTVSGTFVLGVCTAPTVTLEAVGLHYAVGGTLTIQRLPPATQPTLYTDANKYLASVPNNSLDWLCYQLQVLIEASARSLRVPSTSVAQTAFALAARKGMIVGFDSAGLATLYAIPSAGTQPFPIALTPSFPIFLPLVTATTGGAATNLDGLNITAVTQILIAILSIGDNQEVWKLRPFTGGDLNVSDGTTTVVPVTNPSNLRWIRIG